MQTWTIHRGEVVSEHGLVAAQHIEAAATGATVLAKGGNAMDAAVVTALVLATVEPWLSGIGGGGFLLHADGATGEIAALDFNVRASAGLSVDDYPLVNGPAGEGNWFDWPAVADERNMVGYPSMCVPGTIDGLAKALERFGSLSWRELVEPAIAVAERGLAVDWFSSLCLAIDARNLRRFPGSAALFLRDGDAPMSHGEGDYLPMPGQAALLRRLADHGPRDFYEGETAALLAEEFAAGGSRIDAADLAAYEARWVDAQHGTYRGRDIAAVSGLCGGPTLLRAFEMLEADWTPGAAPDADTALAHATAIREAYRERLNRMGHAGQGGDCTTHLSVVDRHGNMVSLTNTLLSRFGSKVVLPKSGIPINNGMMWFDPRRGTPNSIAPGAEPLANMCPVILSDGGRPSLAVGAAGGRTIFPTVAQIISYVVDYGMSLEEAFLTPRIDASTPTIGINRDAPADIAARVATRYPVEIVTDTLYPVRFAIPSAVQRDASGRNSGMSHHTNPWAGVAAEDDFG